MNTVTGNTTADRLKELFYSINKYKYLYILMIPGILYYIIYKYAPMYGLIIAFKDYNMGLGMLESPWVGLKHFSYIFSLSDFYAILNNTIIINFYNLIIGFPMPIILALMLNELKNYTFKRTIQTVIYFPHFLSWVIFGGLIIQLLAPNDGLVNQIIKYFGGEPVFFMSKSEYFRIIVALSSMIKEAGWGAIIYLAALSGIDVEQYEAAIIDGANQFQKLIYITIPGITNTIIIMLILKVGYLLDVGFEQIYVMYNPSVYDVGDVISTYIYRMGLQQMNFSITTAIGLFQSAVGFALLIVTNRIAKKHSEVSLW